MTEETHTVRISRHVGLCTRFWLNDGAFEVEEHGFSQNANLGTLFVGSARDGN